MKEVKTTTRNCDREEYVREEVPMDKAQRLFERGNLRDSYEKVVPIFEIKGATCLQQKDVAKVANSCMFTPDPQREDGFNTEHILFGDGEDVEEVIEYYMKDGNGFSCFTDVEKIDVDDIHTPARDQIGSATLRVEVDKHIKSRGYEPSGIKDRLRSIIGTLPDRDGAVIETHIEDISVEIDMDDE